MSGWTSEVKSEAGGQDDARVNSTLLTETSIAPARERFTPDDLQEDQSPRQYRPVDRRNLGLSDGLSSRPCDA